MYYLDEELPEIEIRELISADEEAEQSGERIKKGINVHSFEDILYQLTLLLNGRSQKALGFARLHKSIVEETDFVLPTIPVASITRKDNSNEEEFFERITEAHKIGNYPTRINELHKAFFGYETTSTDAPTLEIKSPTRVRIADTDEDVRIDRLTPNVQRLLSLRGVSPFSPFFRRLTLIDKITETEREGTEIEVDEHMSIEETFKRQIPTFLNEIALARTEKSLYDLEKDFLEYGIDPEGQSIDGLEKGTDPVVEDMKQSGEPVVKPPHFETYSILGFYGALQSVFNKNVDSLNTIKQNLIKLYKKHMDTPHPMAPRISAAEIVSALLKEEMTLEEVKTRIMARLTSEQRKLIEDWFADVENWDVMSIAPSLETEFDLATTALSFKDEPVSEWSSISGEIQKIKRGEVISKEYSENYTHVVEKDFMMDLDDPEDVPFGLHEEEEIPDMSGLNDGLREIYEVVYQMFVELKKATALELNFNELTLIAKSTNMIRTTKKTALEDLGHADLVDMDMETFNIIDIPNKRTITKHFTTIYNDYVRDINDLWTYLLAWWICELQDAALHNRLHFDAENCTNTCLHLWEPLKGPPLASATSPTGIQPYIICVIKMLVDVNGNTWNKFFPSTYNIERRLDTLYKETFSEKVTTLKSTKYTKPVVSTDIEKKGTDVVNKMNDIITKQLKDEYLRTYMAFLKNLPSVLSKTAPPNRAHLGCCMQRITDVQPAHWRSPYTNAVKLKKYYLKRSKTAGKRPALRIIGRVPRQESKSTLIAVKHSVPVYPPWSIRNAMNAIPEEHRSMDVIRQQITKDSVAIEKYVKSSKGGVMKYIKETATTPRELIECIQKMAQIQYLAMETDYKNSPIEYAFLKEQFSKLIPIDDSTMITNERTRMEYMRILQYMCVRQSYFPCTIATNGTPITTNTHLKGDFIKKFIGNTISKINEWVTAKTFNTSINYTEYITKMREQENISKLRRIDVLSEEERQLYVQAKKLGILEGMQYIETHDNQDDFIEGGIGDENAPDEYFDPYENEDEDPNYDEMD